MSRAIPADRRLYLYVALTAALGLAALTTTTADITGLLGDPVPRPAWLWLGVYVLLVTGSNRLRVRVRIRSAQRNVSWTDAVVLVGLTVLPVPWVVPATAVGILLAMLLIRLSPVKLVIAVGNGATTVFLGGLVLTGLGQLGGSGTGWQLFTLVVTFAVLTAVNHLLVFSVIGLVSGTRVSALLRTNGDIWLVALLGRLAVALATVLLLDHQPQLVYALPLLVLLGHVWHEQWVRTREERRAWQDLAAATASFAVMDVDQVVRRAADRAVRLFSAEVAEVELRVPTPRLVRATRDRISYDGDPVDAPPELERVDVHEAPLRGRAGGRDAGTLRLRFRNRVPLAEREQAMLATYAAALETALRNAAAYGQLQHVGRRPDPS